MDERISILDATGGQIWGAFSRHSIPLSHMCNEGVVKAQTLLSGKVDILMRSIIYFENLQCALECSCLV